MKNEVILRGIAHLQDDTGHRIYNHIYNKFIFQHGTPYQDFVVYVGKLWSWEALVP